MAGMKGLDEHITGNWGEDQFTWVDDEDERAQTALEFARMESLFAEWDAAMLASFLEKQDVELRNRQRAAQWQEAYVAVIRRELSRKDDA